MAEKTLLLGPWSPHVPQEGTGWKTSRDICPFGVEVGGGQAIPTPSEIYMYDLWEMGARLVPASHSCYPTLHPKLGLGHATSSGVAQVTQK